MKVEANGQTFEFPDGTTNEEIGQALDEYFAGNQPQQQSPQETNERGIIDTASHYAGLVNRGIVEGFPSMVLAPVDLAVAAKNKAAESLGYPEYANSPLASDMYKQGANMLLGGAMSTPETPAERVVTEGVHGATEALTGAGMAKQISSAVSSPTAKAVWDTLSDRAALQSASGASGRMSGQVAEEMGAGKEGQALASLGGAMVPAVATIPLAAIEGVASRMPSNAADIVNQGKSAGIKVTTSDLAPPRTKTGKWLEKTAESVPLIGTSGLRSSQQAERIDAVNRLKSEFGIVDDADYPVDIVKSLSDRHAVAMERAGQIRQESYALLDPKGAFEPKRALSVIESEIKSQQALGDRAVPGLIDTLTSIKNELAKGGQFSHIARHRTRVIEDLSSIKRGENQVIGDAATGALQKVKSAIDADLDGFAKANDMGGFARWKASNKLFAEQYHNARETELKTILARGETTPEIVNTVISRGRKSELARLYGNLDEGGREAVKKKVLSDAIDSATDERGMVNPDALLKALSKNDAAIPIFFKGSDRDQVQGLKNVLAFTRRGQAAGVSTNTGQELMPWVMGMLMATTKGAAAVPIVTFSVGSRVYEAGVVRDALTRMAKMNPDSPSFAREYQRLNRAVASGVQGARASSSEMLQEDRNK